MKKSIANIKVGNAIVIDGCGFVVYESKAK